MVWLQFILFMVTTIPLDVCQCTGGTPEVQFTHKFQGPHRGDWFGWSLATTHGGLIVSAPCDNNNYGCLYLGRNPNHRMKINAPHVGGDARWFGTHIATNGEFIVVSGENHPATYIYQVSEPPVLKASIPVMRYDEIRGVVIGGGHTIATVEHHVETNVAYLYIYSYDGDSSWHLRHKFSLGTCRDGDLVVMAMKGDSMAVGFVRGAEGRVEVYRKVDGVWSKTPTLMPPEENVYGFGQSVAIEGDILVVSAQQLQKPDYVFRTILFTYNYDRSTGTWVYSGRLLQRGVVSTVALSHGVLVATLEDQDDKDVCGVVYKLSSKHKHVWEEVAILKISGEPQSYWLGGVSVQDGLVYSGRVFNDKNISSAVFVHNISKLFSQI